MVTKFMINQNLKILHTASFFLAELTVSKINALLIILQSLLAPYQLLLYKKVYFYNCYGLPHILPIEQICTHIPKYVQISHISILPFLFYSPVQ